MANRRKDRALPAGFWKYVGEYEKTWYDIYTWNGVIFQHCWPNAGMFHAESGQYIEGKQIFGIKAEISHGSFYEATNL